MRSATRSKNRAVVLTGIGLVTLSFIILAIRLTTSSAQAAGTCNVGSPTGSDNTHQIQNAIDLCASQGGGEVFLTSGKTYTAGSFELKSNVTLNLNNATIQTSSDSGEYGSVKCPGCHLIFIGTSAGTNNIAIIGPGTIYKTPTTNLTFAMVEFWNSSNIRVENVLIDTREAPKSVNGFHLVSSASDHVTFDGVTIRGGTGSSQAWGNDGIDIQSSQHVIVRNCDIDTHDDGIAIASSSGSGEALNDVYVENCTVASDSTTLKFGTGSDYDFSNVTFKNITIYRQGIRFAIVDGGDVRNVRFSKITVQSNVRSVFNCGGGDGSLGWLNDCVNKRDSTSPLGSIKDVVFEDFVIYGGGGPKSVHGEASINNMDRVTFRNIRFMDGSGSTPLTWFRDICGLSISGFYSPYSGDPQKDLRIDESVSNLTFDGSPPSCGGVVSPPPPTPTPTPEPSPTFADVPFDHWAHDYIEALYQAGYTAGCSSDPLMYCPENTMNRAESAVFVERGIHNSEYTPSQPGIQVFADVPLSEWYAKWADGLWDDGYTAGCGTNPLIYCPLQGHTRAEGTVFYLRMLHGTEYVPPDPVGLFADVSVHFWGAKWIEAAYNAGLIPACETSPELHFCPDDPLTRAMAAYMMVQAKGLEIQ